MEPIRDPEALLPYLVHKTGWPQGERLVTAGLCWGLRHHDTSAAMAALAGVEAPLRWETERWVAHRARVDLLGIDEQGLPVVVGEAKLEQRLDAGQVIAYANGQQHQLGDAVAGAALILVVPARRRDEAERFLAGDVLPHIAPRIAKVLTIEEVLAEVGAAIPEDHRRVWEEVPAMYRHYLGAHVGPFTLEETTLGWEPRADDYRRLALALTDELHRQRFAGHAGPVPSILPWTADNYRYVRLTAPVAATPAVGMFPDLSGVPFALRYVARYTPDWTAVAARLRASNLIIEGGPNQLSVRLRVPIGASHFEMLAALRAQVMDVVWFAHPELRAAA